MKRLLSLATLGLTLGLAHTAAALNASDVYGGWEAEISGVQHIYQFKIRGKTLTGVTCGDCYDATTLAFIDGTFGQDGVSFVVTHVDATGATTRRERLRGTLENGKLVLTGTASGAAQTVQLRRQHAAARPPGLIAVSESHRRSHHAQ